MSTSMTSISSPLLPSDIDPALIEDWYPANELNLPASNSDDLEALHLVHKESVAKRNQDGQVIQHRAWKVDEAFRSDLDHNQESPLRPRNTASFPPNFPSSSSPPPKMPSALISSPIAYPPSSSPPVGKRSAPFASTHPRKPRAVGGFLQDDSEDEDGEESAAPAPKRRMLTGSQPSGSLSVPTLEAMHLPSEDLTISSSRTHGQPGQFGGSLLDGGASCTQAATMPSASVPRTSLLFANSDDHREVRTCTGKLTHIRPRAKAVPVTFEEMVAGRSITGVGQAKKSYYGIDIQQLVNDASKANLQTKARESPAAEVPIPSVEQPRTTRTRRTLMWTEKYRARRFFDLCGDDRTHREVLRWLKGWDKVVFPKAGKAKPIAKRPTMEGEPEERPHRKILLLTGPPGLGKTTLAHVCATQAGYEIMEINASDERSSNVVKGRIRTSVGTESVKTVGTTVKDGEVKKPARPVCVVVDEVDGVVSGSGGAGEGGFIKALIDLIQLDAKNESEGTTGGNYTRKKKKGDNFRLLRPLILICNDVYHPSLRPLRQSNFAEIIHIKKPPLEAVVNRMKSVFQKEGIDCDNDGVRKLCEATWGMSSGPEIRLDASGAGEGDLRSILVVGEWVAGKLKSSGEANPRLTRKWVEKNMLSNLAHGGGGARGVGRGGSKEVVSRVFLTGAGFPKPSALPFEALTLKPEVVDSTVPRTKLHASEIAKKAGMDRLREMIDTSGETDRIVTEIFSTYPTQPFNDDSILSKPDAAYEWLHFHDICSSRVYSDQDWELMPYLSQPILACHDLFASPARHYTHNFEQKKWGAEADAEEEKELPFSGPRADYDAREAEKAHRATVLELQGNLNATLLRSFRSPEDIATDLLPYLVRMLTPEVKPIIVGGSGDQRGIASVRKEGEREMVRRAVDVMSAVSVTFDRGRLEGERGTQWVYRMEPPLDTLIEFATSATSLALSAAPVRYAVRQVLDQEYQKNIKVRENAARQARYQLGNPSDDNDFKFSDDKENGREKDRRINYDELPISTVKKDFFGRILQEDEGQHGAVLREGDGNIGLGEGGRKKQAGGSQNKAENKVWVSFHEGFSNAVRKPITVEELLRGL